MRSAKRIGRALTVLAVATLAVAAWAVDTADTRMLAQPAISDSAVAFVYAGAVWVAPADGGGARRLTAHVGEETRPRFSPDGKWLAFSAQYEGNVDVYAVPAAGGVPRRLTWHPGPDLVQGFTADGKSVLFTSARASHTGRLVQLWTVPVDGGLEEKLPIPNATKAAISPDGSRIAYVPLSEAFRQWKNYRGGTASRILIFDVKTSAVEQIPQPAGRCNDTDPMWIGGKVHFLSDRDGEFGLYAYDAASKKVSRLAGNSDFPILAASAGAGKIVFEQSGYLHLFDPAAGKSRRLKIGVAADLAETRSRWAKGAKWVRNAAISPSGARAAFEFRGEIVTVPGEKGDPRNLTLTPGVNERSPAWAPDGSRIAFFSDRSGEYVLHVVPQDGKGERKELPISGSGFYSDPKWSPDSKRIAFQDNSRTIWWIDLETGKAKKISTDPLYGPSSQPNYAWSPDSKWIAYTRVTPSYFAQVHLYSVDEDRSYPLSDGLSDVGEAVFDASGKYLFLTSSTDAGPVRDWFSMWNNDAAMTNALYLVVLSRTEVSPLAKPSDEEKGDAKKDAKPEAKADAKPDAKDEKKSEAKEGADKEKDKAKAPVKVQIDLEGIAQRIVPLPTKPAFYAELQAGTAGQLYYLKRDGGVSRFNREPSATLCRYDLEKREETVLVDKVDAYALAKDGVKALLQQKETWRIVETKGKVEPGKGNLDVEAISVKVEPRQEWAEMFAEAWRINRDYFYDPNFHGADWKAMRAKYEPFLPDLASRSDLNRLIQWMCSELAVGHHRVGGGDMPEDPVKIKGGLLGADYAVENGRYRFAKVYGGLNWNPELRAPLTEPGVNVKAGEYLLAVEGRDVKPPENLYSRFENTAGRIVELTVGPDPAGTGSRTVKVVPVEEEGALRNRDWVEGNIKKVHDATGGRVAYVYVPNTSTMGHTYFKRYFFPQADKDAIIVDERYNGGGQVADYYIDILRRPEVTHWAMRYGADLKTPLAAIAGPKVMLIDENAGSGGDLLPWMFRKLGIGKLIGKRTWGGLVGILGFPELLDGGSITAPNLAIWTEDGFVVENEGVPPDIEVEQTPADVIAGHDPQLEKAIEVVLAELKANPPKKAVRPPYPVRVRK